MMIRLRKALSLLLIPAFLLSLCSCAGLLSKNSISSVSKAFSGQDGYTCSIEYDVTFSANIYGLDYNHFSQHFTAEGSVDNTSLNCYFSGALESSLGQNSDHYDETVESYTISDHNPCTYYRYGDTYYTDSRSSSFAALAALPAQFTNAASRFSVTESSVLLNNEYEVTIYKADIPFHAHESTVFTTFGTLVDSDISFGKCNTAIELRVYSDSKLPSDFTMTYSAAESDAPLATFTDTDGNAYSITEMSVRVSYDSYGPADAITIPEDFLAAGASGAPYEDSDFSASYNAEDLQSAIYSIYNDDGSYSYDLVQPQYMQYDTSDQQSVTFYYFYSEDDYELYSYTVCDDYTNAEESAFAASLPDLYTNADGYSDVAGEAVQTLEVNGFDISYKVIHMNYTLDGRVFQVMEIYSWAAIGETGQDSLEVDIMEYNASGDGIMVAPVTELTTAYESILGCTPHDPLPALSDPAGTEPQDLPEE